MATAQTRTLPAAAGELLPPARRRALSAGEAVVLAATLGIALVAWASLALAQMDRFALVAALASAALAAIALGVVAWRAGGLPHLVVDRGELAVLAGLALVAAAMFFPGFAYGVGKDPGAYVSHAIAIARVGSTTLDDPVLDRSRIPAVEVTREDQLSRFPAIWIAGRTPIGSSCSSRDSAWR